MFPSEALMRIEERLAASALEKKAADGPLGEFVGDS